MVERATLRESRITYNDTCEEHRCIYATASNLHPQPSAASPTRRLGVVCMHLSWPAGQDPYTWQTVPLKDPPRKHHLHWFQSDPSGDVNILGYS